MKNSGRYRNLDKLLRGIHRQYSFGKLSRKDLKPNPWDQFALWFQMAVKKSDPLANLMVLATASGRSITARGILLKGFDERGLLFHTNLKSRKTAQIKDNKKVSACFYWHTLEKQIIVTGKAVPVSRKEVEAYFRTRPRESQIGTWCSLQSRPLKNREELDSRFEAMKEKFAGGEIPCPPYWGGYRIQPEEFEFWQGRASRLNDRFRYLRSGKSWKIIRYEP